jgi:hypothetical protein
MRLPVVIAPSTKAFPPTVTDDFPSEFQEQVAKRLRRSFASFSFGELTASLQEPPPITYDSSTSKSSTKARLMLEFTPANDCLGKSPLSGLTFTLFKLLRTKTFYAVEPFSRMPSQSLLRPYGQIELHDQILDLGKRFETDICWTYKYFHSFSVNDETSMLAPMSASVTTSSPRDESFKRRGKWVAEIALPIETNFPMVPTFCSALGARTYTLIVRLRILGVRCSPFDLEVPQQVVRMATDSPPSVDQNLAATARRESINLETIMEGLRRGSETSHFSVGSVVRLANWHCVSPRSDCE